MKLFFILLSCLALLQSFAATPCQATTAADLKRVKKDAKKHRQAMGRKHQAELDQRQTALSAKEQALSEKEAFVSALTTECHGLREQNEELQLNLQSWKRGVPKLRKEKEALQQKLIETENALAAEHSECERLRKQLGREADNLRAEVAKLQRGNHSLVARIQDLQAQNKKLKLELQQAATQAAVESIARRDALSTRTPQQETASTNPVRIIPTRPSEVAPLPYVATTRKATESKPEKTASTGSPAPKSRKSDVVSRSPPEVRTKATASESKPETPVSTGSPSFKSRKLGTPKPPPLQPIPVPTPHTAPSLPSAESLDNTATREAKPTAVKPEKAGTKAAAAAQSTGALNVPAAPGNTATAPKGPASVGGTGATGGAGAPTHTGKTGSAGTTGGAGTTSGASTTGGAGTTSGAGTTGGASSAPSDQSGSTGDSGSDQNSPNGATSSWSSLLLASTIVAQVALSY